MSGAFEIVMDERKVLVDKIIGIWNRARTADAILVFDSVGAKRLPLAGSTVSRIAYEMDRLHNAGFHMELVQENYEHYAVIDNEIVWYGSVNLLSKEDVEDNIMRVRSREIAAELLEIGFGEKPEMEKW